MAEEGFGNSQTSQAVADGSFGTCHGGGTPLASLMQEQIQVLMNLINNDKKNLVTAWQVI